MPVALQLELMGVLWAILSVLSVIAAFHYGHWAFKLLAILTGIGAIVYLVASIFKTRKHD